MSLHPGYSHSHMRPRYHVDIVGAVSNGECDGKRVLIADNSDDLGLLFRGDAASDDHGNVLDDTCEERLELWIVQDVEQGISGQHEGIACAVVFLQLGINGDPNLSFSHLKLSNGGCLLLRVHNQTDRKRSQQLAGISDVDGSFDLIAC